MSPSEPMRLNGVPQRSLLLHPDAIRAACSELTLQALFPVRVGRFLQARGHGIERMGRERLDEAILILVESGTGWYRMPPGRRHPVRAGGMLLFPPGVTHGYGSSEEDPWTISWLHFTGNQAGAFCRLAGVPDHGPLLDPPTPIALARMFAEVYETLGLGEDAASLRHAANLLRMILSRVETARMSAPPEADPALHRALAFLRGNLDRPLQLEAVSAVAGLSKHHFVRRFRQRFGATPMAFFTRMRIREACLQLDNSDQAIGRIASGLGFEDPYYFSRVFRQITGHSPRAWRKLSKG